MYNLYYALLCCIHFFGSVDTFGVKSNECLYTYFSLTTVLTVPSTITLLTRLKSPTYSEPSGAAARATGASNLCLGPAGPSQSEQSKGRW